MTNDPDGTALVKRTKNRFNISASSLLMCLGIAALAIAGFVLYQIAWHSPSAYQSYESGQICAVLKSHVCGEIGIFQVNQGHPCGNRDTRWSAGDESTGIEVYGVTTHDDKERLVALASSELRKLREVKALSVRFYDDVSKKNLIEVKLIRRQKP